jgi:hypothetical protein
VGAFQTHVTLVNASELPRRDRDALTALSRAVYPADEWADWPGKKIEWSNPEWCVCIQSADGDLLSYAGIVLRQATCEARPVRIGGVGGIKTHPAARGRGYARLGIRTAFDFFSSPGRHRLCVAGV